MALGELEISSVRQAGSDLDQPHTRFASTRISKISPNQSLDEHPHVLFNVTTLTHNQRVVALSRLPGHSHSTFAGEARS